MTTAAKQTQMFYKSVSDYARSCETFLFLVKHGMTRKELELLIKKRPALWGKFSNWLTKLP